MFQNFNGHLMYFLWDEYISSKTSGTDHVQLLLISMGIVKAHYPLDLSFKCTYLNI